MGKFFKGEKEFEPIKPTLVKTGIKSYFGEDEVLILANRSSNPGHRPRPLLHHSCSPRD